MAYDLTDDFRRPVSLALAALAIVGWLLVAFFWSQASDVRAQMDDALRRAEHAREGMAADLQNLQKAAGTAADLQKQAKDAQKALADAVASRASAQNEIADLTKQISEAKLAISGAQEEANAKNRDLQAVEAKLKGETDQSTGGGPSRPAQAQEADEQRRSSEGDTLKLADLQAAAQAQFADLQRRIDDAAAKAQEEAKPQ